MRRHLLGLAPFVLLLGCSDGGGGDSGPVVKPNLLGSGVAIAQVADRYRAPPPNKNATVQITSVRVVAIDTFDETGDGKSIGQIFVQDFGVRAIPPDPSDPCTIAPHCGGAILFHPQYSPPTFRAAEGDVIDVNAQYQDFQVNTGTLARVRGWTTPELSNGTVSLRFDGVGQGVQPVDIPYSDLAAYPDPSPDPSDGDMGMYPWPTSAFAPYQHGRQWLSMLVHVTDDLVVRSVTPDDGSGRGYLLVGANAETCDVTNQLKEATDCPRPGDICVTDVLPAPTGCGSDGTKPCGHCAAGGGQTQPEITNELYDMGHDPKITALTPGAIIHVTGIVTIFDRFHVAPRSSDDIEVVQPGPPPAM